tara:strand:+ start:75 stop:362 length:288 start_codon:yes stop_codon:yes gene_type:complete
LILTFEIGAYYLDVDTQGRRFYMTRKDFTLVASVVSQISDLKTRNQVALNFASELNKTNDRFDTIRFLAACGTKPAENNISEDDFSSSKESFIAP